MVEGLGWEGLRPGCGGDRACYESTGRTSVGRRVSLIRGSRHHNMKELRSVGGHIRILFAFDHHQRGVVLLGGDKTNDWTGWYKRNIPVADRLYDEHLRSIGKEPPWLARARTGERSAGSSR